MIIGHEPILRFLDTAEREKRLAQVYCFTGPNRIGKCTLAKTMAARLLGVDFTRLDSHPDYTYVERLVDEKSGKLKKDLSIMQARALREKLQLRSWFGGYRVVVINEAETLNEESSNALLKTLEEPALNTVIFLITENEAALLPTIRSRVQIIYFSVVPDDILGPGLVEKGFSQDDVEAVLPLAAGRPGLALNFLSDETLRASYYDELDRFRSLLNSPFYAKVKIVEIYFKDKDEIGERQRERLFNVLDLWLLAWRTLLLEQLGLKIGSSLFTQSLVGIRHAKETVILNIQKVIEAKALLRYNVNQRLVMENCVITF